MATFDQPVRSPLPKPLWFKFKFGGAYPRRMFAGWKSRKEAERFGFCFAGYWNLRRWPAAETAELVRL